MLAVGLFWVGTALSEPSASDRATARSLAGEGYQALQDKDYATAADRFSRADALVHAPTLMIDWARSLVGLGKLVEAQERYEQILREGVDPKSPKSWLRALNDAGAELAELKPRLAWLTVSVSGADDARPTIDGVAVPPAAIGVRRAVNPGTRVVRVQARGFLSQKRQVTLAEGAEQAAAFKLERDPDAQQASPVNAAPVPPPPVTAQPHDRTLMYVAFGVSGAGFILGGVTGGLALGKRSQLSRVCRSDGGCPPNESGRVASYDTLGILSGVGFALGVAGAGSGVALWYFSRNQPSSQGVVVHPYLGLTSVGAVGSF